MKFMDGRKTYTGVLVAMGAAIFLGVTGSEPTEEQLGKIMEFGARIIEFLGLLFAAYGRKVARTPATTAGAPRAMALLMALGLGASTLGCGTIFAPTVKPAPVPVPTSTQEAWNAALISYNDGLRLVVTFAETACPETDEFGVHRCDPATSTEGERAFIRWAQEKRLEAEKVIEAASLLTGPERGAQAVLLDAIAREIVRRQAAARGGR